MNEGSSIYSERRSGSSIYSSFSLMEIFFFGVDLFPFFKDSAFISKSFLFFEEVEVENGLGLHDVINYNGLKELC